MTMMATERSPLLLQNPCIQHDLTDYNSKARYGRTSNVAPIAVFSATLIIFISLLLFYPPLQQVRSTTFIAPVHQTVGKSLFVGIGTPVFNQETGIFVTRYYETRIFFALGNNNNPQIQSKLTLEDEAVAEAIFSDDKYDIPLLFDKVDAEERVDDYILLDGCPGADQIGLKARGGQYSSLELKTIVAVNGDDDKPTTAHWIKSRKKGHFNATDTNVVLDFLEDCKYEAEQADVADVVSRWIRKRISDNTPLQLVRTKKRRRFAYVDGGRTSVQEADIEFNLLGSPYENMESGKTLFLRSWSAEAVNDNSKLESIARNWENRFAEAVTAVGINSTSFDMWMYSYPEMILQVSNLIGS